MDKFVENLKNQADIMSADQLIYLFVPEMLGRRTDALADGDQKKADQYSEVLDYVGTKVELDVYDADGYDFFQNTELKVPSPDQIINQKPTKNIPNN